MTNEESRAVNDRIADMIDEHVKEAIAKVEAVHYLRSANLNERFSEARKERRECRIISAIIMGLLAVSALVNVVAVVETWQ